MLIGGFSSESYAGHDKTSWGMRVGAVRKLYPGGHADTLPSGEVHYRVVGRTFGVAAALTTYCFPRGRGLTVVFVEFPEQGTKIDARSRDYTRPSVQGASRIREALVKEISARYGRPTSVEGDITGGGAIWKKSGDFVALNMTLVDEDRVNLLLRVTDDNDPLPVSDEQQRIMDVFSRTPPETWSAEGAFNAKWGMGPGDLQVFYHNLKALWSPAANPRKTYTTDAYVEGDVGIHFHFHKGRLYEFTAIDTSSGLPSIRAPSA